MEEQTDTSNNPSYPQMDNPTRALASIASLLREANNLLPMLRREFRGEALQQYSDGTFETLQISKPIFVKMDEENKIPIRRDVVYKDGSKKKIWVPNDEAIEEVLSMLKFMGLNNLTSLTNVDEDTILDDLKEFECKLASVLMLKQKRWGMDKELLPMIMSKLKTVVQDARYMACNGATIKAIQKTVQRIESYSEGDNVKVKRFKPYG